MMKKIALFLLCGCLVFSFAACSKGTPDKGSPGTSPAVSLTELKVLVMLARTAAGNNEGTDWENFQTVLKKAEALLVKKNVTQKEADETAQALRAALEKLGITVPVSGGSSSSSDAESAESQHSAVSSAKPESTASDAAVFATDKKLAPMTAGTEQAKLNENPDRGFRWEIWFDIKAISEEAGFEQMVSAARRQIKSALSGKDLSIMLVQSYLIINAWKNTELSAKAFQAVEAVLAAEREVGVKALVRFVYVTDMYNWDDAALPKQILRHIEQVTPVLKKCKTDIYTIEAGFLGAYSEWELTIKNESDEVLLDAPQYYQQKKEIWQSVMNKLCSTMMPELPGIYLQVRLPYYKNLISSSDPVYKRIGVHKDDFWGKNANKSWGSPKETERAFYEGTASYKELTTYAAYTPQGGEMFWSDAVVPDKQWPDGFESILQMSEHRYSSFSGLHGNYDWNVRSEAAMGRWKNQAITESWLKQAKINYSPSFFKNADGSAKSRSVYDFIQYHLGYYIELQSVKTSGKSTPGADVQVSVPLNNYGFAAAFNMRSGFAILDENNRVVSTAASGDPEKWYSRDPDYTKAGQLTHTIAAAMKLPSKAGKYKLAFYLKNDRGDFARTANGTEWVNGYQILHVFNVK